MIVAVVSFANFISDLAGQYENSLYYPISNQLIRAEVREEVIGFLKDGNAEVLPKRGGSGTKGEAIDEPAFLSAKERISGCS